MMKYTIVLIACLIVVDEENVSKANMFDEAKDREPSRMKNKYGIKTIRSGIVRWRNCAAPQEGAPNALHLLEAC